MNYSKLTTRPECFNF